MQPKYKPWTPPESYLWGLKTDGIADQYVNKEFGKRIEVVEIAYFQFEKDLDHIIRQILSKGGEFPDRDRTTTLRNAETMKNAQLWEIKKGGNPPLSQMTDKLNKLLNANKGYLRSLSR